MKKSFKSLVFLFFCTMVIVFTVGCKKSKEHSISIDTIAHGSVVADKTVAKKGEVVTLTVTPDEGYCLEMLSVDDVELEGTTFEMPDKDVVIKASFSLDKNIYDVSAGITSSLKIVAQSLGGSSATADLEIKLTTTGVDVVAYVKDSALVAKDGFAVLFSELSPTINALLPGGKTLKVGAFLGGDKVFQKTDEEGTLKDATFTSSTATIKKWSTDGNSVVGYSVRISLSYTDLGLTKEEALNKLTICPVVYNAYGSIAATAGSFENVSEDAQNTYKVVTGDNQLRDNDFIKGYAQLGSGGGIEKGAMWDTSKDYFKVDENYENRVASLKGHDGMDNNIVFSDVSANVMYAEATIKLTGVANKTDQWPKFGMMLFNGSSQNGLFYYVDAVMNSNTDNTLENIIGRGLGYNKGTNGWSANWIGLSNNQFDLETFTIKLGMVYQNGWAHLYANDAYIESIFVGEYNSNMRFGFKSFGLEMEISNYFASSDPEADGWSELLKAEQEALTVEALFAGDSYMDFWKTRHQRAHLSSYITSYANEGIGGTMVPLWIQKAGEMKKLYNPANILFHISVNDLDSGVSVEDTVNNLKTLFDTYHELFPEATIYWNSLIPNTMFKDKIDNYYSVNAAMEEYMATKEYLVYIDQTTSFELETKVANPMLLDDGLHLSTDFGYPIWSNNMLKAMGYTITGNDNFGDVEGYSSAGWTFNADGSALVDQPTELMAWFKNAKGENVYVEALVNVGELYNNDAYPKFGYVAALENGAIWGFVDAAGYPGTVNKMGSTVLRNYGVNGGGFECNMGWNWSTHRMGTSFESDYTGENYVLLAIAKLNNTLYLLADSKVIATCQVSGEVQIGFETFNLEVSLKDIEVVTDIASIKNKLGIIEPTEAVIDGALTDEIYTEEVKSNVISLGHKGDGRHLELVAVKGTNGVYFVVTTYSLNNTRASSNWWENANIEFRFGNDLSTQFYVLYDGVGFTKVLGSLGIDFIATSGAVEEDGLFKSSIEFFVPYKYFAGSTVVSENIPVKVWGWVFDEGWSNIMNVGTWSDLSVSSHGLRFENTVTVEGNNAAITVTPSAARARVGEVVTLTVETSAVLEELTVKTLSNVPVEVLNNEGVYTFVMPNEGVVVTSRLQGISVTTKVSGLAEATITCEQGIVTPLEVVRFSIAVNPGYVLKSVSVNGTDLTISESGEYEYTVLTEDTKVDIACTVDYDTEGFSIDGEFTETYGSEIAFKVEDNRKVSVWAVKGNNGVYLYFRAYTNSLVNNDGAAWYLNHNFEFLLNMTEQSFINSRGETNRVSKSVWNSVVVEDGEYAGKYMHTAEVFVHKSLINNFEGNVVLNYAFKAPTELARNEWLPNNQYDRGDYWYTSLACIYAQENAYGVNSVPSYLHVTNEGIVNTKPKATNGAVDGDISKYSSKQSISTGNAEAYFHINGYTHDDGYHFLFEIWHKAFSTPVPEWHLNDNVELTVGGVGCGFSIMDGFLITRGSVSEYFYSRVESNEKEGYSYKTIVELFVPYTSNISKDVYVWVGTNGNGFNGWQALCWDGNLSFINNDGIGYPLQWANQDGITMDGVNAEAIEYNDYVTFNPNGATVKFYGKKLNHGAVYFIDINHAQPITNMINGADNAWFNYLNFEIYQGLNAPQVKTSAMNGGYSEWCSTAYHTEEVEGGYHTTIEVYISYGMSNGVYNGGDLQLGLGMVVDGGYIWGAVWDNNLFLTDSGVVFR